MMIFLSFCNLITMIFFGLSSVDSLKFSDMNSFLSILHKIKEGSKTMKKIPFINIKNKFHQASGKGNSMLKTNNSYKRDGLKVTLLMFFILSTADVADASPLNQQMISVRGPFFQGWLLRLIDHSQFTSFIFIIGSFSTHRSKNYDEHYIFCGLDSPNLCKQVELFPEPSSVTITGNSPFSSSGLNITWEAKNVGKFNFNSKFCRGIFDFGNQNLFLEFNTTNRISWMTGEDNNNINDVNGPEGWLGHTPLLPCHYFVHSVGSDCSYRINSDCNLVGNGYAHIEGNHGTFFPEGWVWSQSIHPDNKASFSLVLGKFVIGGISPINIILYIRRKNGKRIIFRSTDFDQFQYNANSIEKTITIKAFSPLKTSDKVELTINSQQPLSKSFGNPIFIPTASGFSNKPGCLETYTALATIVIKNSNNITIEKYEFPLTALEFGGSFVYNKIITNCKI